MECADPQAASTLERIISLAEAESEVISHVHQLRLVLTDLGEDAVVSAKSVADELGLALMPVDLHLHVHDTVPDPSAFAEEPHV